LVLLLLQIGNIMLLLLLQIGNIMLLLLTDLLPTVSSSSDISSSMPTSGKSESFHKNLLDRENLFLLTGN